jgi:hypothetical protein
MFYGKSPQFVCESTKSHEWLLEDHNEQVVDQLYPRYFRRATRLVNLQVKKRRHPSFFEKRLAQSSPHDMAGHFPA